MEYISLYRKYRPSSFNEVVGQKPIIKTLLNSIQQNKISHAYIFSGSKGIGKTSIAKIFAKAVNCSNPDNGDCCNECEICKMIGNNQATDVIELDAASNNGVEEIRKIVESVNFLPIQLKYKVYIIDEAHMLTTSAWNALLKTIEEPPHHVIFIFATTEMNKIPATILSRCQNFQFSRMIEQDAKQIINRVAQLESIKIDDDSVAKIVQLGNGSARDILSILDQLSLYTNNNINCQTINEIFGLLDVDSKISFINKIINGSLNEIINEVNSYSEKGINLSILVSDLISILLDKLIYSQTNDFSNLKYLNKNNIDSFNLSSKTIISFINIWQKNYAQIKTASDAKSVFLIGVFESLNLNQTGQAKTIPSKVQQSKPDIKQQKEPELFEFKTFKIHLPEQKKQPEEELKPKNAEIKKSNNDLSLEDIFMHIAKNTNRDIRKNACDIYERIKNQDEIPGCFNSIIMSKQLVVASNNGLVLLFDSESDAAILNKNYLLPEFQKKIIEYFGHPVYVIGFTKNKINDFVKILKNDKTPQNDLELDNLYKIIEEKSSLMSLAKKLFKGGN